VPSMISFSLDLPDAYKQTQATLKSRSQQETKYFFTEGIENVVESWRCINLIKFRSEFEVAFGIGFEIPK